MNTLYRKNHIFYNSIKIVIYWQNDISFKLQKEVSLMATQIAATPIIKGSEAKKILKEVHRKPSGDIEKGAQKWANIFDKMMK